MRQEKFANNETFAFIDAASAILYQGFMPIYNNKQGICYFRPGDGSGGDPWEDPRDQDENLARQFKNALARQRESYSSTSDPYRMVTMAKEIMTRVENAGRCLILLAPELKPIAAGMLELRPSDRENPGCLEHKFRDLDLS
ncbi:MAG: hypothetical protein LRY76_05940 [Alphaproteobacteria bacterium]|nr:hypothetical protein [Alphaproteobacteria bacterium]